jgi:hypothetical protein
MQRFLRVKSPAKTKVDSMPFGLEKPLQVDLGELTDKKDKLTSYLNTKLKVNLIYSQNRLVVESEELSPKELEHAVNKFVYHQRLNCLYWVTLEGRTVKINKFKNIKKPEKRSKNPTPPKFAHGF